MNGDLPTGWVWTNLGEVTENPQYGWTTRATTEGNIHLLRTTDITSGRIDWSSVPYCEEEPENIEKYLLKDGDIVISRAGSVGYSYLLDNPQNSIFASYLIRFKPLINKFFLYYFLKSPNYWNSISEKSIGIAMANVNASKLKQIDIPLPSLAEQQRIVNKIEELFTKLDKGIESLGEVKYKLKIYRQAILKYAMEGKLTEKWRAENKDKIEPASVLLENIKINNNYPFQYKPINHELPINWIYTRVGNILEVIRGASPRPKGDPKYFGGNIPWIMISDISREKGKFISKTKDTVNEEGAKKSRYLPKGTLILSNSGTVCIPKILSVDGCIHDGFVAFPNFSRYLNMLYFYYYFYYIRPDIIQENKQGVTQVNLNTTIIKNILVSLPPLEEQDLIVERIEQLFSLADYIEETVDSKLEQSKILRQSILKKAFEGKLVPQDPNDEPAEILLEKIKKQKSNKEKLVQEKLV